MSEIARMLGDSDPSNFERAVRKWTGQFPRSSCAYAFCSNADRAYRIDDPDVPRGPCSAAAGRIFWLVVCRRHRLQLGLIRRAQGFLA